MTFLPLKMRVFLRNHPHSKKKVPCVSDTCHITLERMPLDHAWQNTAYYSFYKLFATCQHCAASQNQEEMETITPAIRNLQSKYADQINPSQNA